MATVGLCGLRFWARFPTETYRCPALKSNTERAELRSFARKPIHKDRIKKRSPRDHSYDSRSSTTSSPFSDSSSSHELNNMNLEHPKSSSSSSSSSRAMVEASTEAKGNTTTPAMVLGSERELLSVNKKQEDEIKKLKRMIKKKNKEVNLQVEKLMDLCLNQREEIKSLILSHGSSPRTPPPHSREDASNSWESSSEDMSDDSKTTWM